MFDRIHDMRTRIITSPSFTGDRILGAILFEQTMDRQVEGQDTGDYLWSVKQVVPFLKVDKGLADEADGAQVMKPIPDLADLLERAVREGDVRDEDALGHQEAERGRRRRRRRPAVRGGRARSSTPVLVPIIEPEVDIHSPSKAEAEALLKAAILDRLDDLPDDRQVMLKLTIPTEDGFYRDLDRPPEGAAGRRPLRRLLQGGRQRAPRPEPRPDRQLLAWPHRGAERPAERRGVRRHPRRLDQVHLRGIDHLMPRRTPRPITSAPR